MASIASKKPHSKFECRLAVRCIQVLPYLALQKDPTSPLPLVFRYRLVESKNPAARSGHRSEQMIVDLSQVSSDADVAFACFV